MDGTAATRILILGGGFGGVTVAQELAKRFKRDRSLQITLVNRDNFFVFVPLLASAAAGSLEALHTVAPIRRLLGRRVTFRAEEVTGIDLSRKIVSTVSPTTGREHELPYDHLVLALGNVINLSRLPGVAQHGKTLKTLGDALAIRNHVLQMLEAADIETEPDMRRELLTFVVAGGGFSGVEMVGELNDMVREVVRHYPSIDAGQVRIILLHSNDRILPEMSPGIANYALRQLRKRGVDVRLNARLASATPHEAVLAGGEKLPTRTLIVAVGNAPPPVLDTLDVPKERGRIVTDEHLRVPDRPGLWALGDNALVPNRASATADPSPPTAQFAQRQGKMLAANLAATLRGGLLGSFGYGGLGMLCLIGHGAGVGELKFGLRLRGFPGWWMWRTVYWRKMPSFGRKLQVALDWTLDLVLQRELAQINLARTRTVGREHHEAGEVIFRQGDSGGHFYLIASGQVEVVREHRDGTAEVIAHLGIGEYFGETALLSGSRRNATIRCLTPVDVLTLGHEDFDTLAGAWSMLADHVRSVSDRRIAAAPPEGWSGHAETLRLDRATLRGAPTSAPAWLERLGAPGELPLDRDLITIGRSTDNHVVTPDPTVSRRHALIQRGAGCYWLEDLGGINGVWVNNSRISDRVEIHDGDLVRVGRAEFIFRRAPEPDHSQPATIAAHER